MKLKRSSKYSSTMNPDIAMTAIHISEYAFVVCCNSKTIMEVKSLLLIWLHNSISDKFVTLHPFPNLSDNVAVCDNNVFNNATT